MPETQLPRFETAVNEADELQTALSQLQQTIIDRPGVVAGAIGVMLGHETAGLAQEDHVEVRALIENTLNLTANGHRLIMYYDSDSFDKVSDDGEYAKAYVAIREARNESYERGVAAERRAALVGLSVFLRPYLAGGEEARAA